MILVILSFSHDHTSSDILVYSDTLVLSVYPTESPKTHASEDLHTPEQPTYLPLPLHQPHYLPTSLLPDLPHWSKSPSTPPVSHCHLLLDLMHSTPNTGGRGGLTWRAHWEFLSNLPSHYPGGKCWVLLKLTTLILMGSMGKLWVSFKRTHQQTPQLFFERNLRVLWQFCSKCAQRFAQNILSCILNEFFESLCWNWTKLRGSFEKV